MASRIPEATSGEKPEEPKEPWWTGEENKINAMETAQFTDLSGVSRVNFPIY
jgi:hypothetical protein